MGNRWITLVSDEAEDEIEYHTHDKQYTQNLGPLVVVFGREVIHTTPSNGDNTTTTDLSRRKGGLCHE